MKGMLPVTLSPTRNDGNDTNTANIQISIEPLKKYTFMFHLAASSGLLNGTEFKFNLSIALLAEGGLRC